MTSLPTARVLTIAGSDSGGGAGIQADLKTMLAHGVHGMSVITAVTAQNSLGVQGIWPLPLDAVRAQFRSVVDDIGVDAVKTGMLGTAETVDCVAELLAGLPVRAGRRRPGLRQQARRPADRRRRAGRDAGAAAAAGDCRHAESRRGRSGSPARPPVRRRSSSRSGCWDSGRSGCWSRAGTPRAIRSTTCGVRARRRSAFAAERADNRHTHGTGCTLASALACRLALGRQRAGGHARAKRYVTGAIRHGFPLGAGIGPTDHLWQLRDARAGCGWSVAS